ncbi:conserved unknown protein [Ectocarpus siliculosus]|uniref:Uncharacterized protein n=1 Tax=Ectocarpus siliculosus TaxID=2880 RepID=D7G1S6_ECTSI|nr:conserved unknown protein [Ectocarpus siliculosus]|eukprot:CBJ48652.1 conserved unknown protein [Ectocarpus siliculosus]
MTMMVSGTGSRQAPVQLPSGRFAACWPVGLGQYNGGPAVFLANKRRILDPREEVLPIPIPEEAAPLLSEAMQPRDVSVAVLLRTCSPLFGRNGGMYDNIPWEWSGDDMAKREAFQRSQGKGMMDMGAIVGGGGGGGGGGDSVTQQQTQAFGSAYGLLADVATTLCPADILSLFVEEEESGAGGITLGASAYLRRRPDAEGRGGQRSIIEVTTDEAVGVALALGRQVYVDEEIWEGGRVRVKFVMDGDKMRLDLDNVEGRDLSSTSDKEAPPVQPPAWTIKSRGALSRMSVEEKRECLRATGVRPPRKRALSESEDPDRDLEDLMLPRMDEAVRRDVLMARAWREGDFATAGELCAGKSERHIVAEQLQAALKDNDQDLASILMQRLEILESCRMDPTQDEGSYQRDLDVDEWYEADRRRARQG